MPEGGNRDVKPVKGAGGGVRMDWRGVEGFRLGKRSETRYEGRGLEKSNAA